MVLPPHAVRPKTPASAPPMSRGYLLNRMSSPRCSARELSMTGRARSRALPLGGADRRSLVEGGAQAHGDVVDGVDRVLAEIFPVYREVLVHAVHADTPVGRHPPLFAETDSDGGSEVARLVSGEHVVVVDQRVRGGVEPPGPNASGSVDIGRHQVVRDTEADAGRLEHGVVRL